MNEIEIPERIKKLPRKGAYPVPWFVAKVNGEYDFRVVEEGKLKQAVNEKRCFICGEPLGKYVAYVVGPMCTVNRVSAEPANHRECAEFSAKVCPFLTKPEMVRREADLPDAKAPAGIMIKRNPGVTAVWITKTLKLVKVKNGELFDIGNPEEVVWYAKGKLATRQEVLKAVREGYPELMKLAEEEGLEAMEELTKRLDEAIRHFPKEDYESQEEAQ